MLCGVDEYLHDLQLRFDAVTFIGTFVINA